MKSVSTKKKVFIVLSLCFVLYCCLQFQSFEFSLSKLNWRAEAVRNDGIPYITFLAAILSPSYSHIDIACLRKFQNDRSRMEKVEYYLSHETLYPKLKEFVKIKFRVCVTPTQIPQQNISVSVPSKFQNQHEEAVYSPITTTKSKSPASLLTCKITDDVLHSGPEIDLKKDPPTMEEIFKEYSQMQIEFGGYYPGPENCKYKHTSVVIIPYRNREAHLRYWLHYTLGTLIKQKLRFMVIVVEQEGLGVFNKGQLMNTAFLWALRKFPVKWDCYIFHDVDMISEVYGNLYVCDEDYVTHFAPYIDKFNYTNKVKVGVTVGGAVGFAQWQYMAVNGYPNAYWGWGGEDDDMNIRIRLTGIKRKRPSATIGRYKMVQHKRDAGNPINNIRHKLLKGARNRMPRDGLSNLNTTIVEVLRFPVYTKLLVRLVDYGNILAENNTNV